MIGAIRESESSFALAHGTKRRVASLIVKPGQYLFPEGTTYAHATRTDPPPLWPD